MDKLPVFDPTMLMSAINMLLRDKEFEDLDDICGHFDVERAEIEAKLASAGYTYDPSANRIV